MNRERSTHAAATRTIRRMNDPSDESALIVWLQLLGLLAGLAVVGAAVFWATRSLQR